MDIMNALPNSDHEVIDPDDPFRLLGRLAAGVAHDLSNYLTVLEVSLELLRRREHDPVMLSHAHDAVGSATRLVRSLLEYARGGTPEPAPIDLGPLVRRTLAVIGRLIPPTVDVVFDAPRDLPAVRGIACQLEQLVLNLVLNACEAMPTGGELRITLRAGGRNRVWLEIADTGSGLAVAAAAAGPRGPSTRRGRRGAGLGLGIVRSVAERHGACLRIIPGIGGGTRISVGLEGWSAQSR
jgi:signal transduction histidine kinase